MIEFIKAGETTKAEVVENLGAPTASHAGGQVFVYRWETGMMTTGPRYNSEGWHNSADNAFAGRGPGVIAQGNSTVGTKLRAFCIAFDRAGRVAKSAYLKANSAEQFETTVLRWLSNE